MTWRRLFEKLLDIIVLTAVCIAAFIALVYVGSILAWLMGTDWIRDIETAE